MQLLGDGFEAEDLFEFVLFERRECTDDNPIAVAEGDFARGDPAKFADNSCVDGAAHDDGSEMRSTLLGGSDYRTQNDLIELRPAGPPAGGGAIFQHPAQNALGVGDREFAGGSVQSGYFSGGVGHEEKIAILGLPGVFAGVGNGGGVAVAQCSKRGEKLSFVAERDFVLMLHDLESKDGAAGLLGHLFIDLLTDFVADDEQRDAHQERGDDDERKKELGAELEVGGGLIDVVARGLELSGEPFWTGLTVVRHGGREKRSQGFERRARFLHRLEMVSILGQV